MYSQPIVILGMIVLTISGCSNPAPSTSSSVPLSPADHAYYNQLQKNCESQTQSDCCDESIKHMRDHGYRTALGSTCPDGQKISSLRCPNSYQWCEPEK